MSGSIKRCSRCHGPLEARLVEHPYWDGINLIAVVHEVPSWVCQVCGYHYFDPRVETTLKFIIKDYEKLGGSFPVPMTSYREIQG